MAKLYADYGGHPLLAEAKDSKSSPDSTGLLGVIVGEATRLDESSFEANCESIGAGGRGDAISPKAQEFFSREDVRNRCRSVVDLEDRLARANAELPSGQQVVCP